MRKEFESGLVGRIIAAEVCDARKDQISCGSWQQKYYHWPLITHHSPSYATFAAHDKQFATRQRYTLR